MCYSIPQKNDTERIETAFGEAVVGMIFNLDQFNASLSEGVALAESSTET
jgi:hypothetical protein